MYILFIVEQLEQFVALQFLEAIQRDCTSVDDNLPKFIRLLAPLSACHLRNDFIVGH